MKEKEKFPSELRMDLVSNDWVVIATGRAKRPESFAEEKEPERVPPEKCPFCREESLEGIVAKKERSDGTWSILGIRNKYPAFSPGESLEERKEGPNRIMNGLGYHEVVVYRDHDKQLAQFSKEEMEEVVDFYQARYLDLKDRKFVRYISIFHNHGPAAGASVYHPHSQILAIPVIDPDLRSSLDGAEAFYRSQGKCVYCVMLDWGLKDGRRIIFENDKFVVLCPFAPQVSFEIRIYPKEHQPYFEKITEDEKRLLAEAFQQALSRLYRALKKPAFNFYFHTAPCNGTSYNHYHWHINILPKTAVWAGFELGAGIEISTIEPEKAADFLRKK